MTSSESRSYIISKYTNFSYARRRNSCLTSGCRIITLNDSRRTSIFINNCSQRAVLTHNPQLQSRIFFSKKNCFHRFFSFVLYLFTFRCHHLCLDFWIYLIGKQSSEADRRHALEFKYCFKENRDRSRASSLKSLSSSQHITKECAIIRAIREWAPKEVAI